jgi:hypothetical protein
MAMSERSRIGTRIPVEIEFRHLSTGDLMKAYANAIEATSRATREMARAADTGPFRAARLRLDLSRQACEDLRQALLLRPPAKP